MMKDKSFINSIDSKITKKNIFWTLVLVCFILFINPIQDFYDKNVVRIFLKEIQPMLRVDITFLFLIFIDLVILFTFWKRNRKINSFVFGLLSFAFILFLICRFQAKEDYQFYSFTINSNIKYADTFIIVYLSCLLLKLKSLKDKPFQLNDNKPFLIDIPVKITKDDKYNRAGFAEHLAIKIQSDIGIPESGSLAIGINGPWGSGKTSFMFLIKEKLNKEATIIMDFNPWLSQTPAQIIESFFKMLSKTLVSYDPSLSTTINDYAKTLTDIHENSITKGINNLSSFLFDDISKSQSYERINTAIRKSKRRLIIFIDDLDRLDEKEVIEVLRIIRNTANFNNVVYVVSYDKAYVLEAVKSFNKHNHKAFLEKIFQFEFTLPGYEESVNRDSIKSLLEQNLEAKFHKQIHWVLDDRANSNTNFTNEIIKTHRDVVRLVNSLLFEIEPVKNEVLFYDFYLLQLLKLKYPRVYTSLYTNRYKFFVIDTDTTDIQKYRLRRKSEVFENDEMLRLLNKTNSNKTDETDPVLYYEYLLNEEGLALAPYELDLIKNLTQAMLRNKAIAKGSWNGEEENVESQREASKGFYNPRNFHKYFAFSLFAGDLSDNDFETYRVQPYEQYLGKINSWVAEGKSSELKDKLLKITDFSDVLEYENHVRILFHLGKLDLKEINIRWFDYNGIIRALMYPILKFPDKTKKLRLYGTSDAYRLFILSLFHTAPSPYIFESQLIEKLIVGEYDFVLAVPELEEMNLSYFKSFVAATTELSDEFFYLFYNCKVRTAEKIGEDGRHLEADKLCRFELKKRYHECDLGVFIKEVNRGSNHYNLNKEDWWSFVFSSKEEFEIWLHSADNLKRNTDCFKEFDLFYNVLKNENFENIMFGFKYLKSIR